MKRTGINLDIILPYKFDLKPDGDIVEVWEDIEDYYFNEECTLQITFEHDGRVCFDYLSDSGVLILTELYSEIDCTCEAKDCVKKQYEIASLLKISTVDI